MIDVDVLRSFLNINASCDSCSSFKFNIILRTICRTLMNNFLIILTKQFFFRHSFIKLFHGLEKTDSGPNSEVKKAGTFKE